MKFYSSPRWSGEILDCSMPMTFDTYGKCSYNCIYCFSYYQKSHTMGEGGTLKGKQDYQSGEISAVDIKKIERLFNCDESLGKSYKQFFPFIKQRKVIQWGGLSDQFDEYERKYGKTLELLKIFKKLNYPICFSTKGVWWLDDERYTSLFEGRDNWNCKFSIINLNPDRAKIIEQGVSTPMDRIEAIRKYTKLNKGGATLRLRPFILGLSDRDDEYLELIKLAADAGATAVSTEFFCLESRADSRLRKRYSIMSEVVGYDLLKFYRKHSRGSGYLRLTRQFKKPYFSKMKELCDKLNLRFYVSDAHFKEMCHNGSCCGLSEDWNYSRGQFTEAIVKAKKNCKVRFSDIAEYLDYTKEFKYRNASGFNKNTSLNLAIRYNQTMFDYIREIWNNPESGNSPYKYFGGVLAPKELDENGDIVYYYVGEK